MYGESIEMFEAQLHERLNQLHEDHKTGCYQPLPLRRRPIPKPDNPRERRNLDIPTVSDRVAQAVVKGYLEPELEKFFHPDSYG